MTLRRYIAVVQDPRGYPTAALSDDDAEPPCLYTVVKADEHEAELERLCEALTGIRDACEPDDPIFMVAAAALAGASDEKEAKP